MLRRVFACVLPALMLLTAACGGGDSTGGSRSVDVVMVDNDFSVASLQVHTGETVTFTFHNNGKVVHEAFIGDEAAQTAHEQQMMAAAASGGSIAPDPNTVVVAPGQTGTLVHTFSTPGRQIVGCHEAGHYASGMRMVVTVG